MKQIWKLSLLALVFLMTLSCTKEDVLLDEIEEKDQYASNPILGEWNLMHYSGGLMGQESYNKDDVTWTFNSNGTVDVLINTTLNNSMMPITTSQTANYVITGTKVEVLVNNFFPHDITYDNGKLILSNNPALDGPRIEFERD